MGQESRKPGNRQRIVMWATLSWFSGLLLCGLLPGLLGQVTVVMGSWAVLATTVYGVALAGDTIRPGGAAKAALFAGKDPAVTVSGKDPQVNINATVEPRAPTEG